MSAADAIFFVILAAMFLWARRDSRKWWAEQDKLRLRLEALERGELQFRGSETDRNEKRSESRQSLSKETIRTQRAGNSISRKDVFK